MVKQLNCIVSNALLNFFYTRMIEFDPTHNDPNALLKYKKHYNDLWNYKTCAHTKHIRLNMRNTNYNNHLTNTIFVGMHNFETGQGISFGSACEF